MSLLDKLTQLNQLDLAPLRQGLSTVQEQLELATASADRMGSSLEIMQQQQANALYQTPGSTNLYFDPKAAQLQTAMTRQNQFDMDSYKLLAAWLNKNTQQFAEMKQQFAQYQNDDVLRKSYELRMAGIQKVMDGEISSEGLAGWMRVLMPNGKLFGQLLNEETRAIPQIAAALERAAEILDRKPETPPPAPPAPATISPSAPIRLYEIKFANTQGQARTLTTTTNPEEFLAALEAAQRRSF